MQNIIRIPIEKKCHSANRIFHSPVYRVRFPVHPPIPLAQKFIHFQSIITEESREAYNSLVEKPAQSLQRVNYEIANLKNHLQLSASMTALQMPPPIPKTSTLELAATSPTAVTPDDRQSSPTAVTMMKLMAHSELKVPSHPAPRPNTLPDRNALKMSRDTIDCDTNPLRILRDKNYPIVRPRMKVNIDEDQSTATANGDNHGGADDVCESPSYLTPQEYTFSERDVNIHHGDTQKFIGSKEIENLNPIPLPPRDRNKVLLTSVKRHVRKHPLIIPATGLQRTLSKVTTPVEEKQPSPFPSGIEVDEIDSSATTKPASSSNKNNYNMPHTSTKPAEVTKFQPLSADHSNINQENINVASPTDEQKIYTKKFIENNFATYENLDSLRVQLDSTDSASLHFESILESDINPVDDGSHNGYFFELRNAGDNYDVPRISADSSFASQRHSTPSSVESKFAKSLERQTRDDVERKKLEFSQKYPNYSQPKNELTDNALFIKFRESAEGESSRRIDQRQTIDFGQSMETEEEEELDGKLKDSNSVSCEDLLEFADKKPKGKERGIESDEVRIMTKVLGTVVSVSFDLLFSSPYFRAQKYRFPFNFFFHWNTGHTGTVYHCFGFHRMECASCNQNDFAAKRIEGETIGCVRGMRGGIAKVRLGCAHHIPQIEYAIG